MRRSLSTVTLLLMLGCLAPGAAQAQFGPVGVEPKAQLFFTSLTAGVWNPWGAQTDLIVHYRRRLWDSQKVLFGASHIGAQLITRLNPAYARVGFGVELQPLAILTLRASYEHRGYFGTAGMIQSYETAQAEYDDDTRSNGTKAGNSYITTGQQFILQAIVRAKLGPIAVLNEFSLAHYRMNLRPGDRVFYEAFYDTLTPGTGNVLVNHAHLLYITKFGLVAGLRYSIVHALYDDAELGNGLNRNTPNHKLGPLVAYTFGKGSKSFQRPTLILILNWWTANRYRTGQRVNAALPYGIIAFTFSGEMWTRK